jgi:hypothetical protein
VGTRRASALPDGTAVGRALHELPVDIETDAAEMDLLLHLIADSGLSSVGVLEATVNRDPLREPARVHHDLPHLLRWRVDVN